MRSISINVGGNMETRSLDIEKELTFPLGVVVSTKFSIYSKPQQNTK